MINHSDPTTQEVTFAIARDFRERFNEANEQPGDNPYTLPELFVTHQTSAATGEHVTRHVPIPHEELQSLEDFQDALHHSGHFVHEELGTRVHSCTILAEGVGGHPDELPFDTKEELAQAVADGVQPGDFGEPVFAFLTVPLHGDHGTCALHIGERKGNAYASEPRHEDMAAFALQEFTDHFWSGYECSSTAVN